VTGDGREPARTLEALARTGERFKELIEAVPAVIYEAEPGLDAPWHYVSPQLEWLLGDAPEEWVSDSTRYTRRLHPEDREAVFHVEDREFEIARGEGAICVSEYRMLHRDGRVVWIRDEARLMGSDSSAPFWRGVLLDITPERAARHALAETYQRFRDEHERERQAPASRTSDVFRITCSSCGAVHAAERAAETCAACGSEAVRADSMAALEHQLQSVRGDLDDLLDGIHRHLEMLGASLHGPGSGPAPRVVTPMCGGGGLAGGAAA